MRAVFLYLWCNAMMMMLKSLARSDCETSNLSPVRTGPKLFRSPDQALSGNLSDNKNLSARMKFRTGMFPGYLIICLVKLSLMIDFLL